MCEALVGMTMNVDGVAFADHGEERVFTILHAVFTRLKYVQ